jgi:hypothetical protein
VYVSMFPFKFPQKLVLSTHIFFNDRLNYKHDSAGCKQPSGILFDVVS